MFSKLKALLEYAGHYEEFSKRRTLQLEREADIDASLEKCSKSTQLEYFRTMRELNRSTSRKGYSLDLYDTPTHVLETLNTTDDIQKIMMQSGCKCKHAVLAISLASEKIKSIANSV